MKGKKCFYAFMQARYAHNNQRKSICIYVFSRESLLRLIKVRTYCTVTYDKPFHSARRGRWFFSFLLLICFKSDQLKYKFFYENLTLLCAKQNIMLCSCFIFPSFAFWAVKFFLKVVSFYVFSPISTVKSSVSLWISSHTKKFSDMTRRKPRWMVTQH